MTTRRRWAGLVPVVLIVGPLVLASCSTTPASPTTTSGTSNTQAKPYGSLKVGVDITNVPTDPLLVSVRDFHSLPAAIFDTVTEMDTEGRLAPGIAKQWEISKDGLTHTFYIRNGVKFHDGSDLTGADVKFSIERVLAPDSINQNAPAWRATIAGVDLKDDYTVALRLKTPQFELLNGFADFGSSTAVVPKKYIEEKGVDYFRQHPIGSGPFRYISGMLGQNAELEALDTHWKAVPKFKNISLVHVTSEGSKIAMLKTGELDIAQVAPDSIAGLKIAGLKMFKFDGAAQAFAAMWYDLARPNDYALGDVRVRKALSLATNRKDLADKLFAGYAEPGTLFYGRPTAFYWDANVLKPDPFDPGGARKLLAEAGYPNGFSTKIWDKGMGSTVDSQVAQAVAGYWRSIGVKAEVVPIDSATMSALYRKPGLDIFNSLMVFTSAGGVFQFERMLSAYHSKKGMFLNSSNSRLDELIDKVPTITDPIEKKKLALEAAVLAKNDYTVLAILDPDTVLALSSKVDSLSPVKGLATFAASLASITHAK